MDTNRESVGAKDSMMAESRVGETSEQGTRVPAERHDILNGTITVAAILLFVGTGSAALSSTIQRYFNDGPGPDQTLVIALLLNVALILFGWRRHRELAHEVAIRTAAE